MELITNILIEYLKHNKRIIVPRLGAFIVKQPSGIIRFSDLMRNDDGVLRSLLMAYGVKELEANGMIDRFVFEIRHAIGRRENFIVKDLGEFSPGENNTIIFTHKHEPIIIGGNIKPPVEILNAEKQRLQKSVDTTTRRDNSRKTKGEIEPKRHKRKESEEDTLSLGKPDAYLRGLKYDKEKNKKRGEERTDSRRSGSRPSPILLTIVLLIVIGATIGGWWWLNNRQEEAMVIIQEPVIEHHVIEADSTMVEEPIDTLKLDSNMVTPIIVSDSTHVATNNNTVME